MEKYNEIMTELEGLKNSPLADEEYCLSLSNFCGAIQSVADATLYTLDFLVDDVKRGSDIEDRVNKVREGFFQICSLSEAIQKGVRNEDFIKFGNLMHEYNKLMKK